MNKISKIVSLLEAEDIDAILITSEENMHYLCGFSPSEGMIVITKSGEGYHFVDSRYTVIATRKSRTTSLNVVEIHSNFYKQINQTLCKHSIATLAIENKKTTLDEFQKMKEILSVKFCNIGEKLSSLRSVKDENELVLLLKAQEIADKSFVEFLNYIKIGKTEKELVALFEYIMSQKGSDGVSFDTIFVSGQNSSMPHGVPSEKKIKDGDFITIDFGATYHGYHSDTTRTIAIGHCTDEMMNVYDTVLKAQLAALDFIADGKACKDAHNLAFRIIAENGYGEFFKHGLGHGVGLEIHEGIRTSPTSKDVFQTGNVTSVEPGIYLPEKFGVRIEDVIYVNANGNINLTKLSKKLMIL